MRVCSLHFKHEDYVLSEYLLPLPKKKILRKTVVPSINLPITIEEKKTASRNKERLNRIVQRSQTETCNISNTSSNENGTQDCDVKNILEYREQSAMDQACENIKVEIQSDPITMSERLDIEKIAVTIKKENEEKGEKLVIVNYSFADTLNTDEKIFTATGIPTLEILEKIITMVKNVHRNKFETCKLKTRERVILTYMKMKHNTSYKLLALIFTCVSAQVCQKIVLKTIKVLSSCLSIAIPWPSKEVISKNLPTCFKGFETTRVVLDCIEIFIQQPKNLCNQLRTYLQFKGSTTIKFMIGVSPAEIITHVSPAYGGRTSDTAIFSQSKLLNLLEPGDGIMVDRRFLIDDLCHENGWKCIQPPSLDDKKQFSQSESIATSKIDAARVDVERVNKLIKVWSIVGSKMPFNLLPVASEILNVLCATVNLSVILNDEKLMDND